jgi:hypothetical protein
MSKQRAFLNSGVPVVGPHFATRSGPMISHAAEPFERFLALKEAPAKKKGEEAAPSP